MTRPRQLAAVVAAAGTATASLLVFVVPAAGATTSDNRYSLFAQGDSQYYQIDGQEIPVSPTNSAGSLTAQAQTDNTGQTSAFAGAPFYGKSAETGPGTVNAVPNQFGDPNPVVPFSHFPGYVTASMPSQPKSDESNYYYKVHAEATDDGAKASGSNGAPDSIPAPNQQQVATAEVKQLADGTTLTTAEGSASGFIEGPLEVGDSDAKALIKDAGGAPKIESSVFGKFSIGGQAFGYNKSGFTYLGQSADKKAALDSANDALKAAGIELEIAPESTTTDPVSGMTRYVLGGLKVTSTFTSPTTSKYTIGYILGRVEVSSVNAPNSAAVATGVSRSAATMGGLAKSTKQTPAAATKSPAISSAAVAPKLTHSAALPPTELSDLRLAANRKPTTSADESLYVMLVLAGAGVLMVPALFSLATRSRGRRR
jgi:hypothetical protein